MIPAMSAVPAETAIGSRPSGLAMMFPFRKMMYAMTMNVVRPARASVTRSVPRSANLKYSAIPPPLGAGRGCASSTWFPTSILEPRRSSVARTAAPSFTPCKCPPCGGCGLSRNGPTIRATGRLAAGNPTDSIPLLDLQTRELHLDEAARVELELAGAANRHPVLRCQRRVLDDHPLVALDEAVDEELVRPRVELEMLERVDVQGDRDRGEIGRRLGV